MSFFHKKKHNDNDSFWTSYSDLFLGLSSIFLMLYVVASLRSGTEGIKNAVENRQLKVKVQDLENQLETYESIKQNYINNQASQNEVNEYTELMDKLSLLQEEANSEKRNLEQAARENARKEKALNKYQQMVRNVINKSTLAKVKINTREDIIVDRESTIDTQAENINQLNRNVSSLESNIKKKDSEIAQSQKTVSQKTAELKNLLKKQKINQKVYQARLQKLQQDSKNEIQGLMQQRNMAQQSLNQTQAQLSAAQGQLSKTQSDLEQSQSELAQKGSQIGELNAEIGRLGSELDAKVKGMKGAFAAQQAKDLAAFKAELGRQKNLGAAEIARREGEFKAASAAKERKLAGEIAGLAGQLKDTQGKLAQANSELAARKQIAEEIKAGFKKAGVKADIDMGSGDVVLDFGGSHFDSDSSALKTEMKSVLQDAMPVYAKSLFGNAKLAKEISAVEIIGFASPTYRGKIVDPYSAAPNDRDALKYNMDLSYQRARSIFNYILDDKSMKFSYRDSLVPTLKVSGRSFLDLMKMDRNVASVQDYCAKNDCKKSQKVIIRFSMNKK